MSEVKWTIACPYCKTIYEIKYPHEMTNNINCQCGAIYQKNYWFKGQGRFLGFWVQKVV